jgi:hypothetical protein
LLASIYTFKEISLPVTGAATIHLRRFSPMAVRNFSSEDKTPQALAAQLQVQPLNVDYSSTEKRKPSISVPAIVILGIFILGWIILVLAVTEIFTHNKTINTLLEHFSSACIVASILGLSYEQLAHKKRQQDVDRILEENRKITMWAFNVFIKLTPQKIFGLLRDIAGKSDRVPTLYEPARQNADEYTFANSIDYFDSILKIGREEITQELESWIADSNRNLKFLASDFIGKYQLDELKVALEIHIDDNFNKWALKKTPVPKPSFIIENRKFWDGYWSDINVEDSGWILNYLWAFSRCETPMYKTLEELLLTTQNEMVQEWILFIPQQMPTDVRFLKIIPKYLAQHSKTPRSVNSLKLIIKGIGKMESLHVLDAKKILLQFPDIFNTDELKKEIREVWQAHGLKSSQLISSIEKRKKKDVF